MVAGIFTMQNRKNACVADRHCKKSAGKEVRLDFGSKDRQKITDSQKQEVCHGRQKKMQSLRRTGLDIMVVL
ncbi:MAG: hypothetical protein A4E71_00552 [Smithella sp. PtaU1.Bin162]|nr:MAG: hypothetical protein A4E71_00552 [Smithella sp. PtaU1.Bin162]